MTFEPENNLLSVFMSIGKICPKWTPIGKKSVLRFRGFAFSGKKCEFSCLFFLNRDYLRFFGEIPDYRDLKCALIAPIGRRNSIFMGYWLRKQKRGYAKLWKNLVDFTSALYPVEYDIVTGCNLTPDPVLPDTDTIIIFRTSHLVDIKILENVP